MVERWMQGDYIMNICKEGIIPSIFLFGLLNSDFQSIGSLIWRKGGEVFYKLDLVSSFNIQQSWVLRKRFWWVANTSFSFKDTLVIYSSTWDNILLTRCLLFKMAVFWKANGWAFALMVSFIRFFEGTNFFLSF